MGNGSRMQQFLKEINGYMADSSYLVLGIDYRSEASPDGNMSLNDAISNKRARSITEYIQQHIIFSEQQVKVTNLNEDWDSLLKQIEDSQIPYKQEIFEIFRNTLPDDSREAALKRLGRGKAWEYMSVHFFPGMRKVTIVVNVGIPEPQVKDIMQTLAEDIPELPTELGLVPVQRLHVEQLPLPTREGWYLKTNLSGIGFLMANISAEVDLGRGFSFVLPVYYSAWDYSGSSKYRTFTLQPELRYWFNKQYTSLFAGVHFGLGWYNFARGEWRKQDKDGSTPAAGGGISAGYRLPLQKNNPRWFAEFAVGAGVYPLHYDRFYNIENGALESTIKETYFGVDQIAVNIVCKFGGKRRK